MNKLDELDYGNTTEYSYATKVLPSDEQLTRICILVMLILNLIMMSAIYIEVA
jgi:hypothetical protein